MNTLLLMNVLKMVIHFNKLIIFRNVFIETFFMKFSDEYTVEYLDPEYMNTFVDEIDQNDSKTNEECEKDETNENKEPEPEPEQEQPKNQVKRKYPYKCKKCSKRFVYKEVYEAHIRMHKGLPGFSYVFHFPLFS